MGMHNNSYPKVSFHRLNQALCLLDSQVIRNCHLRLATSRYAITKLKIILLILFLTSAKCNEEKASSIDKTFYDHILNNDFVKAFKMLDTNSLINHHNSRDTVFIQLKVIREYLYGREVEYKCDSFVSGNFIGMTSSFIPLDSNIQFGLEVRFVGGQNSIYAYSLTQNERWFSKFLSKPKKKIDASQFILPSLKQHK